MKWGFIYTLDEPSAKSRVDTIGTLVCVGVRDISDAPDVAMHRMWRAVSFQRV